MKKTWLISFGILILSIFLKGLFINKIPNSISLQEIDLLRQIHLNPSINDFSFRLISVFISSVLTVFVFNLIFIKTKNISLSVISSLTTIFAPWIIIMSRFLNINIFLLFVIVGLFLFIKDRRLTFFIALIFLIGVRFLFINNDFLSIKIGTIIPSLITLFDFRLIFFQGDLLSPMLRIPMTGFFIYLDLLIFFCGLYYLTLVNKDSKLKEFMLDLLILGIVYFFILPSDMLMTIRSEFVLLFINLIIGLGYFYTFKTLKKTNILLLLAFIIIFIVNTAFYAELLINHFDQLASSEWSYAEQSTASYLINQNKTVYLSPGSGKLDRILNFFNHKKIIVLTLPINQMRGKCYDKAVICVMREDELQAFDIEKNSVRQSFGNYDGLPIYFVLPN